jgi:hypothetical protein
MNIFVPVRKSELYSLYDVGIVFAGIRDQKNTGAGSEKHTAFVYLGAPDQCGGYEDKFKAMQDYFEIGHYSHALKCGFTLTIKDISGIGAVLYQVAKSNKMKETEIERIISELNEYSPDSRNDKKKKVNADILNMVDDILKYAENREYKKMRKAARICRNSYTYLSSLPDSMPSVFLGLFLAAAGYLQSLKFNDIWNSVTVTGDIDFKSGELKAVDKIKKKFNGLFQDYVKENPAKNGKKHLFLYVTDERPLPVPEGDHDNNIYVKAYPLDGNTQPDEFDVMDYVFKSTSSWTMSGNANPREIKASAMFPGMADVPANDGDELRIQLAENFLNNRRDLGKRYIETPDYRRLRKRALRNPDFRGYFIHGEGSRGKSFAAAELAHYLLYMGRFFSVIWIEINNQDIKTIWERTTRSNRFDSEDDAKKHIAKKYIRYIETRICKQPGMSTETLNGPLEDNPHLIVIDNLELPKECLSDFLSGINIFLTNRRMASCIITSRGIDIGNNLESNIEPKEVPQFSGEHTKELFYNTVKTANATDKIDKYKITNGDKGYDDFISQIHENIGEFPGVITIFGNLLRQPDVEIPYLKELLAANLGAEDTVKAVILDIYKVTFNHLTNTARKLLLFLLNFGADMDVDTEQIEKKINEWGADLGLEKGMSLKDALRELVDSLLLYCP